VRKNLIGLRCSLLKSVFVMQLPDRRHHIPAKLSVLIKEQESVRRRVGPRFSHLLHDPKRSGVARHIEMQNLAPLMTDNKEAVQDTKM
jgi:hypothetical protein